MGGSKGKMEEVKSHHLFWTGEESGQTVASNLECGYRALLCYRELIRLDVKVRQT